MTISGILVKFARSKLGTTAPVIDTRHPKPITDTKILVLLTPRANEASRI